LLLLCSHLGLPSDTETKPLTLREWNSLAGKMLDSPLQQPGAMMGRDVTDLRNLLGLDEQECARLASLLERGDDLWIELRRLESAGIRVLTRGDAGYPQRYRQRLGDSAPLMLFYAGNHELLGQPGIAVVGSRNLDKVGQECAALVGNACGFSGLVLYSGGARGVDTISMRSALESRGFTVGVLALGLEKAIRIPDYRAAIGRGDLCLVTPYSPDAGFSVGAAMGRNRLIYTLADYAIVVASDANKGGTWAGSTEALKAGWLPVFVLQHENMPEGNRLLIQKGAIPLPYPLPVDYSKLRDWLQENATTKTPGPNQLRLL
jgi:predicted Rossmann fold nucleotide-binding protein DprA/Smf involved in DNA uptake